MERHRRMRAEQGLPPKVTDAATLERIATIVRAARRTRLLEATRTDRRSPGAQRS
jgi:hypothetical protein